MHTTRTFRTRAGRHFTVLVAVVAAALLALPAVAEAWSQVGADGAGTHQGGTDGPDDPGLKWFSELSEVTGDAAPDGFSFGGDSQLVIGNDGTIVRTASADGQNVGQGNRHLVGIDPADGSLTWNRAYAQGGCNPAVDSQGRTWGVWVDGDDPALEALDSATGDPIAGTRVEPMTDVAPGVLRWCQNTSLHIGGAGNLERAILFDGRGSISDGSPGILAMDVSGATAAEAWVIDPEDAPFGRVMRDSGQERIGALSDDSLFVATVTGDTLQLTRIALANGDVTGSVDLPIHDADGDVVADSSLLTQALVMVEGSTAVVATYHGVGGGSGALYGVDVSGSMSLSWTEVFVDERGSRALALSGGNVISGTGAAPDDLHGYSLAAGTATSWSGGAAPLRSTQPRQYLTDASGTMYVNTRADAAGALGRTVTSLAADGTQVWRFTRAALLDAAGLDADQLNNELQLGAVGPDGTLYLHRDEQIVAIDNSGGLAEEDQCQLPFTDVGEFSTHAANICRLVELEVTSGTSPTTYGPREDVTRAQMATFLTRALGLTPLASGTFPDVDPSSVHAPNINAIREAGITEGRADGTYDPGGQLTRAEMATFLQRAAGLDPVPTGTGFTDVDPGNVHTPNIYAVRDAEITLGATATTFDPTGTVRRDQMASFLIRMIDHIDEQG